MPGDLLSGHPVRYDIGGGAHIDFVRHRTADLYHRFTAFLLDSDQAMLDARSNDLYLAICLKLDAAILQCIH